MRNFLLNPMSTMRVPLAAEPEQEQSFVMASWLARSVLLLFAVLVVAAVIPRFSIALPAMEQGDSDVQVGELAFERCCSNGNEKFTTLPAITSCMTSCLVVTMSFVAGMVALAVARNRPQLERLRSLSDREIEPAFRPPKAGLQS